MASLWSVSKALHIPLDASIENLYDVPYTISFVIRKLAQIDNFYEMPKDKRPPEDMLWEGSASDIEEFIDRVYKRREKQTVDLVINEDEVE